jgi:hypothetical protein
MGMVKIKENRKEKKKKKKKAAPPDPKTRCVHSL